MDVQLYKSVSVVLGLARPSEQIDVYSGDQFLATVTITGVDPYLLALENDGSAILVFIEHGQIIRDLVCAIISKEMECEILKLGRREKLFPNRVVAKNGNGNEFLVDGFKIHVQLFDVHLDGRKIASAMVKLTVHRA